MLKLKPGVSLRGMRPEIMFAMLVSGDVVFGLTGAPCEVTSVTDGDHHEESFHHNGLAFDFHVKGYSEPTKAGMLQLLREELGVTPKLYDIVHEDPGGENEHIHIEYDDGEERPMTREEGSVFRRQIPIHVENQREMGRQDVSGEKPVV